MDRSSFCGCKGVRTCIKCEQEYGYENKNIVDFSDETFVYCHYCNKAWQGYDIYDYKSHPNHIGKSFCLDGVYIKEDFLTVQEAEQVMKQLDELPWDKSQSGRRKQNFGPKCNFKKQKIKLGEFQGFPACTKFIQDRFHQEHVLDHFQTIEQCTLEYNSENGSSIDNHIDDCWIWGERIVTVNIIGDSVLTLTLYPGDDKKYNLSSKCYSYKKKYSSSAAKEESNSEDQKLNTASDKHSMVKSKCIQSSNVPNVIPNGRNSEIDTSETKSLIESKSIESEENVTNHLLNGVEKTNLSNEKTPSNAQLVTSNALSAPSFDRDTLSRVAIRIPMPARSLLVLWGESRYEWQHCVLRSDVNGRRVAIAYREFTSPYVNCEATREVFEKAQRFF